MKDYDRCCIHCSHYLAMMGKCGWKNVPAKSFDPQCEHFAPFNYLNPEPEPEEEPVPKDKITSPDIDGSKTYSTGAKRDKLDEPAWHLLPFQAISAIAKVLTAGAEKYGPRNWEQGLPITSYLNHAMVHIGKYILSETIGSDWFGGEKLEQEDHLAHAACNLLMAMETRFRVRQGVLPEELMDLGGKK